MHKLTSGRFGKSTIFLIMNPYAGPIGETLDATVVPEFSSMVIMILILAITSTLVLHKVKNLG